MAFDDLFSTPADNPLVPRFPLTFRNTEILTVIYRTEPRAIGAVLPPPLESTGDLAAVHIYKMNDADGFGRYLESAVQVGCRLSAAHSHTGAEEQGAYSPYLYLGSDGAVAAGSEVYGQPKKGGRPELKVVDDLFVGRVWRNGIDVITATLPYKVQRRRPEDLQRHLPFIHNINMKLIPDITGVPAIKQITGRHLTDVVVHEVWGGPATLELRPNAQAPVYRLPVREVLEGFYWVVDFTLPVGAVLHDYLAGAGSQP